MNPLLQWLDLDTDAPPTPTETWLDRIIAPAAILGCLWLGAYALAGWLI